MRVHPIIATIICALGGANVLYEVHGSPVYDRTIIMGTLLLAALSIGGGATLLEYRLAKRYGPSPLRWPAFPRLAVYYLVMGMAAAIVYLLVSALLLGAHSAAIYIAAYILTLGVLGALAVDLYYNDL